MIISIELLHLILNDLLFLPLTLNSLQKLLKNTYILTSALQNRNVSASGHFFFRIFINKKSLGHNSQLQLAEKIHQKSVVRTFLSIRYCKQPTITNVLFHFLELSLCLNMLHFLPKAIFTFKELNLHRCLLSFPIDQRRIYPFRNTRVHFNCMHIFRHQTSASVL